ncbi:hypothetical protein LOK49_LG12G02177 [Camellia lanceoleosa]|uniref:Uncharacterized protein n=1 Tax=Camellia lanceoleosa TaxID=1840588 RepID=A0ACC0FUC7_9ERIC|nr:hypothetical protein LOK49_LG12G02177 [Camellia lanceoleosa]
MLICFRSNLSDEDIFCSAKMVSNVEAAKSDLEVGQMQREGFMYKIKLDPIEARMKAFFGRALSTTLANITFDTMENVDELEVYPSRIPDLLSESPLIVSGRYKGDFPETLKARGILADMSNFVVDLKVQKAKDIPIDKVLAKQEIDLLSGQAWFSENKEVGGKIARIGVKYGIVGVYLYDLA